VSWPSTYPPDTNSGWKLTIGPVSSVWNVIVSALKPEVLVDAMADAIVVIDGDGTLRYANKATERLFGWTREERVGTSALDLIHPDDLNVALLSLTSVTDKEIGTPIELRIKSRTGWLLVEIIGAPMPDGSCEPHVILSIRDLTERRRWEVTGGDDDMFRTLVQNGAALTILVSNDGVIMSASAVLTRQLGLDPELIVDKPLTDIVASAHQQTVREYLNKATTNRASTSDDRQVSCEVLLTHADGRFVPFQISIVDLVDDPTVGGLVVTGQDVTELHRTRSEMVHNATHDGLTGIPNRAAITEHLTDLLAESDSDPKLTVAFVDLDRFKPVNDLFGHEAGDELLIAVASRLQAALRQGDVVGRFGGDEFVVVAAANDTAEAHGLAERLESALASPYRLACGVVQIYASVGVALADAASTTASLLAEADSAMYSAKYGRRGFPRRSRPSIGDRQSLATAVEQAFERNEFTVHYQPIVDMVTGQTLTREALIRWEHPELGLLMPAQFLDIVEALGAEAKLGEVVLAAALRDLAIIEAHTGLKVGMSVNVAGVQLSDPGFATSVSEALAKADVTAEQLTIEISEMTLLERSARGPATPMLVGLLGLNEIGVSVTVDDFGTGHSSLTHLVSFPIGGIKIDRSFIDGVVLDDHRRTIVAALIALASGMNMNVVAEGIETPRQHGLLSELGCASGQGFLYGAAEPVAEILRNTGQIDPARN